MNQLEQQLRFSQLLTDYWMTRGGISILKKQLINEVELNPFKLYKSVCKRGGAMAVSNSKSWKEVVEEAVSPALIEEENTIKKYYMKTIYPYQKKVYFGYEEQSDQPNIISSRMKNQGFGEQKDSNKAMVNMQTKSSVYAREMEEVGNPNLLQELEKYFEKQEKEEQLYYLRKNKMEPTIQQLKRIQIGLPSLIPSEVIYALNMLLLYSTNTNNNLLFDEFQNIIRALESYISVIYPPKNAVHLQHLRTLTLIVRNFCINTSYLQSILKTELFNAMVLIYNENIDKECSKNVVETMTGLVKVGWDCKVIVNQIAEGIANDNNEDIEIGVDMIRGLVDERQQTLEDIVVDNLDIFAKLFVSSTPEIRETVLEILAYISDLSTNSRTALAKHPYLVQKLIETVGSGVQQFEKLCQLSALTLSNISVSPGAKEYIRHFEKDLVMIACSDERIGNIAAGILSELDSK